MTLYRQIDVWERTEAKNLVRYRCLESLSTGKFHVQSADFYREGEDIASSDQQFRELLSEQDPARRSEGSDTLAKAIAAHKRDFS